MLDYFTSHRVKAVAPPASHSFYKKDCEMGFYSLRPILQLAEQRQQEGEPLSQALHRVQ